MNSSGVHVLIRYQAKPGCESAALRELTALVSVVRAAEPDCTGITIVGSEDQIGHIVLIETWTSREAYAGPHLQTPHIQDFIKRSGSFMAGPPEITYWNHVATV